MRVLMCAPQHFRIKTDLGNNRAFLPTATQANLSATPVSGTQASYEYLTWLKVATVNIKCKSNTGLIPALLWPQTGHAGDGKQHQLHAYPRESMTSHYRPSWGSKFGTYKQASLLHSRELPQLMQTQLISPHIPSSIMYEDSFSSKPWPTMYYTAIAE